MSWRIVSVSSMCKLDYKMDYLVVRNRDGVTRIHMSEIAILMLESTAISLTAYLLRELDRRKIDVIFCDETRTPYGMLSSLRQPRSLDLPALLLEWMRLHRAFFGKRLFILYGLKSLLSEDELGSFYRSVFYEKLDLLLIEAWQQLPPRQEEVTTIIDRDLCVLQ